MIDSIYTVLRSQIFEFIESIRVKRSFYRDPLYRQLDQALLAHRDPFAISKEYLVRRADSNLYQYGETPLTSIATIAKRFGIDRSDTVIEMGSGSGRTSFLLAHFTGCQVIGIERIDTFVNQANALAERFNRPNVTFKCGNMLKESWDGASYLYLYQSMLSEEEIRALCERLECHPTHIKVVTVSYPLNAYHSNFRILDHFSVPFSYGNVEVYLNGVNSLKK